MTTSNDITIPQNTIYSFFLTRLTTRLTLENFKEKKIPEIHHPNVPNVEPRKRNISSPFRQHPSINPSLNIKPQNDPQTHPRASYPPPPTMYIHTKHFTAFTLVKPVHRNLSSRRWSVRDVRRLRVHRKERVSRRNARTKEEEETVVSTTTLSTITEAGGPRGGIERAASRSVGVGDSNGRRSVSRLLRGSYVNMETGSWNPVLDSTYDSNQRG